MGLVAVHQPGPTAANLTVEACTFRDNFANDGGAISAAGEASDSR